MNPVICQTSSKIVSFINQRFSGYYDKVIKTREPGEYTRTVSYLVEEVLNKFRDSDVVVMAMNEQHLLQMFELRDGVVTVPRRLTALFTHNS